MSKTALYGLSKLVFYRCPIKEPQTPVWAPQAHESTQFLCFVLVKKAVVTREGEALLVLKLVGDVQPSCKTYCSNGVVRKSRAWDFLLLIAGLCKSQVILPVSLMMQSWLIFFFFFLKEDLKFGCCFAGSAPKFCRALCMVCDQASQKQTPNMHYVKLQVKTSLCAGFLDPGKVGSSA